MTTNEPPNQLKWFLRALSGIDSGQWDWGIREPVPLLEYNTIKLYDFPYFVDAEAYSLH